MVKKRFNKNDWLEFALDQLAKNGPEALKLANLCAAAQRTTGSFYHHFEDHDFFIKNMLSHWRDKNTKDVIEIIDAIPTENLKSERLNAIAMAMNQSVEIGIRALAQQNGTVAKMVSEVDQLRIDYLASMYSKRSGLDPQTSVSLAELEYAAFVGTQMIWKGASLEHGMKLSSMFDNLVDTKFEPK